MQKLIGLMFSFMMTWTLFLSAGQDHITWLTSYEEAVNQSKASNKPIVLFFTGSDWCGWCTKLEKESLETKEFAQAVDGKLIFVKLDFPMNKPQPANIAAQNKQLQKKFDIRGYPTLVIIDSQEKKIGVTGYRPGGGKQYADHLFKIINDFTGYQQKVQSLDSKKMSGADLKQLYQKAQEFGLEVEQVKIITAGMQSDEKNFFKLERYRYLANEGHCKSPEALQLRQELLQADSKNESLTHYQIALIDFETLCEEDLKGNQLPEVTTAPLKQYIDAFGKSDKDNLWRLYMIISQVYLDKLNFEEAIKHARSAHEAAPASMKPEISAVISTLQSESSEN